MTLPNLVANLRPPYPTVLNALHTMIVLVFLALIVLSSVRALPQLAIPTLIVSFLCLPFVTETLKPIIVDALAVELTMIVPSLQRRIGAIKVLTRVCIPSVRRTTIVLTQISLCVTPEKLLISPYVERVVRRMTTAPGFGTSLGVLPRVLYLLLVLVGNLLVTETRTVPHPVPLCVFAPLSKTT